MSKKRRNRFRRMTHSVWTGQGHPKPDFHYPTPAETKALMEKAWNECGVFDARRPTRFFDPERGASGYGYLRPLRWDDK